MSRNVKTLSKKTVLQASHFTVIERKLEIPGKGIVTRQDVERKPTVAVLPVTDDYHVFVISEYRYLYEKMMLGIVAGFMEEGETPLETAKRELAEEAGLTAKTWSEIGEIITARSVVKAETFLFLAKGITEGNPRPEDDENIEVVKLSLAKLVEKVMKGEIRTAVSMVGILMLDRMKNEGSL